MRVFVAGATGALGKQLVPMLVADGHDVVGMTRTEAKVDQLRSVGAQPVVADALDANAVGRAVGEAEPEVIVHQLTAIPPKINRRRFDRSLRSPTGCAPRTPPRQRSPRSRGSTDMAELLDDLRPRAFNGIEASRSDRSR